MSQYKYFCEKCNYGTDIKNSMVLHNKSTLHTTGIAGKRNIKSDDEKKIYNCEKCDFVTKNKNNFIVHKLNKHSTKEERQKEYKYYCELCDFGVLSKSLYDKHIETSTHKNIIEILKKSHT
jgi:hypothetical protein